MQETAVLHCIAVSDPSIHPPYTWAHFPLRSLARCRGEDYLWSKDVPARTVPKYGKAAPTPGAFC